MGIELRVSAGEKGHQFFSLVMKFFEFFPDYFLLPNCDHLEKIGRRFSAVSYIGTIYSIFGFLVDF